MHQSPINKVLSFYNSTIDLIEINENNKAPDKPFIYKGAFGEVVTGICKIL